MAHGPNFAIDYTLFIQLGLFLASWFVLHVWVFRPYVALLEARKRKTVGLREKAQSDIDQAGKLKCDYEIFMKAERKRISQWSEEERRKMADEQRAIVQRAREDAAAELQTLRKKNHADLERASRELMPLVTEYSSLLASKVLGYKVKVTPPVGMDNKKACDSEFVVPG